jgi:diacylglycerol kinase family enzyme
MPFGPYAQPVVRIIVLLNAAAGTSPTQQAVADDRNIRAAFGALGVLVEVQYCHGHHLTDTACRLVIDNPLETIIVAAGGDGTQSAVAAALAGTSANMGVLPMGTLNHFAKDLGVPLDISGAARVIATGQPRAVDIAQLNDRVFINNASIGLYPEVVRHRDQMCQRFGHGKWYAMLKAVIAIFRRYPVVRLRIAINEENWLTTAPFVFVGNNQYYVDGLNLGQRSTLEGGDLSVYFANRTGRLGLLRLAFRALLGRLRQDKDFNALRASELWIDTPRREISVALDGEVHRFTPPLHFRTRPKMLNVILPVQHP